MSVELPNTNPILDPPFWSGLIEKYAKGQMDAAEEIREYGTSLLMRLTQSRVEEIEDAVLISALFRQALLAFDAAIVCMREGAVPSSLLHCRSLFESSLYLGWMLHDHTTLRAERYYVWGMRQELGWALQNLEGTAEHAAAKEAWSDWGDSEGPWRDPELVERSAARAEEIRRSLQSDRHAETNALFDARRGKRAVDVMWYQLQPHGVRHLHKMSVELGREGEHQSLYRFASYHVHGSIFQHHVEAAPDGQGLSVAPVRSIRLLSMAYRQATMYFIDTMRVLVDHYRPEEMPVFVDRYVNDWRSRIQMPEFDMKVQRGGMP